MRGLEVVYLKCEHNLGNKGHVTRRGNVTSSLDPFALSLSGICALPSSLRFGDIDTSAGRSTEARGLPHAFPAYDPRDTLV